MTLKIRWLAALVLLLAVGAVAVRAEEEEAPPGRPYTVELLPAPQPVAVDASGARLCWPSTMPGAWSMPSPCPVPMPYSLVPAVFSPVGECCPYPNCPLCAAAQTAEGVEYVVEMKMVKAGADGDEEVKECPRLTVLENQTGTVELCGVESSKERLSLRMQAIVAKTAKGVVLDLQVVDSCSSIGVDPGLRAHTETTETRCPVALGKATKLELSHDSHGACTSWVEVTVTAVESEAQAPKTVSAGSYAKPMAEEQEAQQPFGVDDCVEILQDLFGTAADLAAELTGTSSYDEPAVMPAQYLQCPPVYSPQASATTAGVGTCPTCSAHSCGTSSACTQCVAQPCREYAVPLQPGCGTSSACTQCVATEEAKQQAVHIGIDTLHHRVVMESNDGKKHVTTSADRITVHDGCLLLEGNVHMESSNADGSVNTLTGDKMSWKLPKGVDYHIGD